MKPTDEERREVAARLRVLASHREVDKEMFHDAIGVWPGGCIDGYDPVGVMHLADLVEPAPERTCMPIMPPYEPGVEEIPVCSECGRQMFIEDGDAYCPRCGAKVIEEES